MSSLNADRNIEIYREIMEHLQDVVFCHDPAGRLLYLSPSAEGLVGYGPGEAAELDFRKIIAPEFLEEAFHRTELQGRGEPVAQPWELQVLSRGGERIWVQIRTQPVFDDAGRLQRVYGVARDIRVRKRLEELQRRYESQLEEMIAERTHRLRESEHRFRELAEMLPETVFEIDLSGRLTFVNRRAFDMFGLEPQAFEQGLNAFDMLIPEDLERAGRNLKRVMQGEDLGLTEYTARRRDGSTFPVLLHSTAILREGLPVGARGFVINIKERKDYENALRESEERYRRILETVPDWIAIARVDDGRFIQVNEYFSHLTGYTREEVVGRTSIELGLYVSPADRGRLIDGLKRRGEVKDAEIRFRTKNGKVLDTLLSARRIEVQGEDCLVSVVTDVTRLKKAERELARLAVVIEQATESIFITERDGTITYANPAFVKASGYSRDEIVGSNMRDMKCERHDDSYYRSIWEAITQGRVWKGRIVHRTKDGMFREFESAISPIRDDAGKIVNFVAINRDVTQEVALEAQLRQAQKLEAIGTLAGGIAHDFNNILSAIIGYSELARLDAEGHPGVQAHLQEVLKGAKRARDLVKQILTFSRQGQQERKPILIGTVVKEALRLLRATLPTTIDIRQQIQPDCGPVEADPTQIHQVLMNLCTNSAHAMRETGGTLEVELRAATLDRLAAGRHPDLRPGPYLELTVKDSGHGIRPEALERIFDPYFTTKEKGEGTGLGLAVVQGIVKSHGGAVTVESRPGAGAAFHILLPSLEVAPEVEHEAAIPMSMGRERILLVDDENDLVEIGKLMLERLGYSVTTRTSSIEALELFRDDPQKFDLVVTDMTMPNLTGDQLAGRMMAIRPDLPVILCTGYSERMTEVQAREIGVKAFVMKPVVIRDLSVIIRKVLEQA
jgi:PAS domain S-box-containing protein